MSRLRSAVDQGFPKPLIHTVRGQGYRLEERGLMSLRWKLVLLYALILAVVIGGFGLSPRRASPQRSSRRLDAELLGRAQALGAVIEFEDGAWSIDPESGIDGDYEHDRGLYYFVRAWTR